MTIPKPNFAAVVDSELPVLYRIAMTLTRKPEDAEDLVSQTLYLGAKNWSKFDGAYPRSWLIQILRNEFARVYRQKVSRPTVELDSVQEPSEEGFWKAIDWALVGDGIHQEVRNLPEEYALAVSLCDIEELSYEEAAVAMDVPLGTVRSRLYRGRKLLRARLVRHLGALTPT